MIESTNQSKTLWLGDLQAFMDETYLSNISISLGYSQHLTSVKIIKDKITGLPSKYGFLQFTTHKIAQKFMIQFNNKPMPNSVNKYFKIKWASYGGGVKPSNITSTTTNNQISVYVGDLQSSVNQTKLLQFFKTKYPSAFSSKIIMEPSTKISKGYGFVKFVNPEEAQRAISEMNGISLNSKNIKVSHAYMKNKQQVKQEQPNDETQAAQRIKIYQEYYSTLNDPVIKADYEKQMQKMFGKNFSSKKNDFKNSLQGVKTLNYGQTKSSQRFLQTQPKMISYNSKREIERIFLN